MATIIFCLLLLSIALTYTLISAECCYIPPYCVLYADYHTNSRGMIFNVSEEPRGQFTPFTDCARHCDIFKYNKNWSDSCGPESHRDGCLFGYNPDLGYHMNGKCPVIDDNGPKWQAVNVSEFATRSKNVCPCEQQPVTSASEQFFSDFIMVKIFFGNT